MQNKRYNALERQTVVPAAVGNISIINEENTTVNYHGIRFTGRVIIDVNDGATQFGGGWITLMCLPPGVSTPVIDSSADAEAFQQFIVATEQWFCFGGGSATDTANGNGSAACHDFDIVPMTSRNCMKDAKITGQITNDSASHDAIVSCVLSTFETTN